MVLQVVHAFKAGRETSLPICHLEQPMQKTLVELALRFFWWWPLPGRIVPLKLVSFGILVRYLLTGNAGLDDEDGGAAGGRGGMSRRL